MYASFITKTNVSVKLYEVRYSNINIITFISNC